MRRAVRRAGKEGRMEGPWGGTGFNMPDGVGGPPEWDEADTCSTCAHLACGDDGRGVCALEFGDAFDGCGARTPYAGANWAIAWSLDNPRWEGDPACPRYEEAV